MQYTSNFEKVMKSQRSEVRRTWLAGVAFIIGLGILGGSLGAAAESIRETLADLQSQEQRNSDS